METYKSMKWYEKTLAHVGAGFAILFAPITVWLCAGFVIWCWIKFGKTFALHLGKMYVNAYRFMVTHNLKRLCEDIENYEEQLKYAH